RRTRVAWPRRVPTPPPTRRSRCRAVPPPRRTETRRPSSRWRAAARRRAASPGGCRRERDGNLLQLSHVIEIVQAREEQDLAPVQLAEHPVLDHLLEARGRIGAL